jgi:protein O-mannosyl-transferase
LTSKKKKHKVISLQNDIHSVISSKYFKHWKFIIPFLVLVVYGQTISFNLVYLDDDKIILDHQDKISSLSNIIYAFKSEYGFDQGTPYYRPIIITSFILDAQFSKTSPTFYHISNIVFHILTVIILFLLLTELSVERNLSFFFTLVFAIHPLLTNAVVWIPGRNDLLATLFSILSFRYFIKYLNGLNKKYFVLHIVLFWIAILSKEVALILPLLCLLYLYFYEQKNFSWKFLFKIILIWIASIVVFQLIKMNVVGDLGNVTYGIPALLHNLQVIPEVLYKIFIPINISVLPTFSSITTGIGIFILIIIIVLPTIIKKINKRKYYFGLTWFFAFIVPGLAILYADQNEKFDYLDTRTYLPMIGILIILSEIFSHVNLRLLKNKNILLTVSVTIILTLSMLTFFQSKKYENAITFAESAVLSNPEKPFFYQKLADYYYKTKSYEKAVNYLKIAIAKSSEKFAYYKNLILAYAELKQYDNAINTANDALAINPNDPELFRAVVLIYYRKGDYKNALKYAEIYVSMGGVIDKDFYKKLIENQ